MGQSNPLCGGASSGQWFVHQLLKAGQLDFLGGGTGGAYFLLSHQDLHACETRISYLSWYNTDYQREAHLLRLFLRHIPQLLEIQTCWSHCIHADTIGVHSILDQTQLLIVLPLSGIQCPLSSAIFGVMCVAYHYEGCLCFSQAELSTLLDFEDESAGEPSKSASVAWGSLILYFVTFSIGCSFSKSMPHCVWHFVWYAIAILIIDAFQAYIRWSLWRSTSVLTGFPPNWTATWESIIIARAVSVIV